MKKTIVILLAVLVAVPLMFSVSEAKTSYLNDVNATCNTNYNCGLCHKDPSGGGSLTTEGARFQASGYDSCYFCPTAASCTATTCTDRDGDGYFAEGGTCGPVDCNDTDANIHPGACDILRDGIDQDCSGKDRLHGRPCR
jgi:hypothetical protein